MNRLTRLNKILGFALRPSISAMALCVVVASSTVKAGPSLGGIDLWVTNEERSAPGLNGSSLLRPPASWSWDVPAPVLDFAAGVGRHFGGGLNFDAGISVSRASEPATISGSEINYRDYFLGVSYGAMAGRIWYLPEVGLDGAEQSAVYYEAGWDQPLNEKTSFSVRLGHYNSLVSDPLYGESDVPSVSLGATTTMSGYGVGLRLIDGGRAFGGGAGLSVNGQHLQAAALEGLAVTKISR